MRTLLAKLAAEFPQLTFTAGDQFYWSPETREVFYNAKSRGAAARWSLLHETGHALLEHQTYRADIELLQLEVAAWERARQLADSLGLRIDNDHIEDCLDTYRDWLYRRSLCPACGAQCLQQDTLTQYRCHNCHATWRVSANRFCRAYRATKRAEPSPAAFNLQADF